MRRFQLMGFYVLAVVIVLACAVAGVATLRTPPPASLSASSSEHITR